MSRLVLNHHMTTYFKILTNSTHLSDYDKVIPWIASSKSSDQKLSRIKPPLSLGVGPVINSEHEFLKGSHHFPIDSYLYLTYLIFSHFLAILKINFTIIFVLCRKV